MAHRRALGFRVSPVRVHNSKTPSPFKAVRDDFCFPQILHPRDRVVLPNFQLLISTPDSTTHPPATQLKTISVRTRYRETDPCENLPKILRATVVHGFRRIRAFEISKRYPFRAELPCASYSCMGVAVHLFPFATVDGTRVRLLESYCP